MGVTAYGNIMYRGIRENVIVSVRYQFNLCHSIISKFYLRNTFTGLFDRIYRVSRACFPLSSFSTFG